MHVRLSGAEIAVPLIFRSGPSSASSRGVEYTCRFLRYASTCCRLHPRISTRKTETIAQLALPAQSARLLPLPHVPPARALASAANHCPPACCPAACSRATVEAPLAGLEARARLGSKNQQRARRRRQRIAGGLDRGADRLPAGTSGQRPATSFRNYSTTAWQVSCSAVLLLLGFALHCFDSPCALHLSSQEPERSGPPALRPTCLCLPTLPTTT